MLAIAQVAIMTGRPRLIHIAEVMGVRVFSDSVATMMFALEPMIVPVPPKAAKFIYSTNIVSFSRKPYASSTGRTMRMPVCGSSKRPTTASVA